MANKNTMKAALKVCSAAALVLMLSGTASSQGIGAGFSKEAYEMLVSEIFRMIFAYGYMGSWMILYGNSFTDHFREAILANPSFNPGSPSYNQPMAELVSYMMSLVVPLYLLAILLTAVYMLFISGSPEGKANAKELFKKLIISMIIVSLSPLILETLMNLSQNLSASIMDSVDLSNTKEVLRGGHWGSYWIFTKISVASMELGGAFWGSLLVMAWVPYILVLLRYILVVFFSIIFPLGVVLYSFVFLRDIGRKILEQTLVWIYMQVFLSIAIAAIALSVGFYSIVPPEEDLELSGLNFAVPPLLPGVGILISAGITLIMPMLTSFISSVFNTDIMATSILKYTLGAASYALFVAVTLLMVRVLGKFLP